MAPGVTALGSPAETLDGLGQDVRRGDYLLRLHPLDGRVMTAAARAEDDGGDGGRLDQRRIHPGVGPDDISVAPGHSSDTRAQRTDDLGVGTAAERLAFDLRRDGSLEVRVLRGEPRQNGVD